MPRGSTNKTCGRACRSNGGRYPSPAGRASRTARGSRMIVQRSELDRDAMWERGYSDGADRKNRNARYADDPDYEDGYRQGWEGVDAPQPYTPSELISGWEG